MFDGAVQNEQILMIVKAYPNPSERYGETACTAGIRLSDLSWVRIYPYPFRMIEPHYRFKKWDIVETAIRKASDDPRPDSYKLYDVENIKFVDHLDNRDAYWTNRMNFIHKTSSSTVEELISGMLSDNKEWGLSILPVPVVSGTARLSWEYRGNNWSPNELQKLEKAKLSVEQNLLLSNQTRERYRLLKKNPYFFRLTFCDMSNEVYKFPVLDWEIYQLYFNARSQSSSDEEAIEKVRRRVEDEIFSKKREVYLVLGNIHHRFQNPRQLAINGFIWPVKQPQPSLLEDEDDLH